MRFNFITFCKKEKPKVTRRIPQLLLVVQEKEIHFFVAFETDSKKRNQMDRRCKNGMLGLSCQHSALYFGKASSGLQQV
ncbi:uncharacterized protein [Pocillopora verrucosa]|uniref:uncharacterized protein isoform X4 n=1 Tax=Pocillopora verrucosa TaxID=203993 RepID=UPI0033408A12